MARLRSSSLFEAGQLPITIGSSWLRRSRNLRGDGTTSVPGCLTGESEERETWTAESLRAAFPRGSNPPRDAVGRDFGGRRFRSTLWLRKQSEWDLVKRCDQPGKSSLQLESLILAQSERWRQA